jgi:hypothetical protein
MHSILLFQKKLTNKQLTIFYNLHKDKYAEVSTETDTQKPKNKRNIKKQTFYFHFKSQLSYELKEFET